jgi:hypothetical protein
MSGIEEAVVEKVLNEKKLAEPDLDTLKYVVNN